MKNKKYELSKFTFYASMIAICLSLNILLLTNDIIPLLFTFIVVFLTNLLSLILNIVLNTLDKI